MTGNTCRRALGRRRLGPKRRALAQSGTLESLLLVLLASSCGDTTRGLSDRTASDVGGASSLDSSQGVGTSEGAGASNPGGSGGTGSAVAGGAGETSTTEATAGAAGAGEAHDACQPDTVVPLDACEYPESLGGAGDPTGCGVTAAAWYPLGNSELATWPERAAWRPTGGWGPAWRSDNPEVAFDLQGRLVVAWMNEDGIELRRWNSGNWDVLAAGAPGVNGFEMVLEQDGDPVVVTNLDGMAVLQWQEESWISLGQWPPEFTGPAEIVLDAEDRPIVVYQDDGRLFAERWNGSSFEKLAGDGANGSLSDRARASKPAVALRQNGNVVVAWTEAIVAEPEEYGIYATWLQQWNGERWEPLGGSVAISSEIAASEVESAPAVAVDADDRVIVAWDDEHGAIRIWDGTAWSPQEAGLDRPQLLRDLQGSVYLAGDLDQLELWQWQSDEWVPVTVPVFHRYGREPGLAVADDTQLAVARPDPAWDELQLLVNEDDKWRELGEPTAQNEGIGSAYAQLVSLAHGLFSQGADCRVDRWDGQGWQALDLSNWVGSLGDCSHSTLTESPTGQPVLGLWIEELEDPGYFHDVGYTPNNHLYLLGWTDAGWKQLAAPYPHTGIVDAPKIAFDASGTPWVGWTDYLEAGGHDIWVMAWNGTDWLMVGELFAYSGGLQLLMLPDDRMIVTWSDADVEGGTLYEAGQWKELAKLARPGSARLKLVRDTNGTPFLTWHTQDSLALYELSASGWQPTPADETRLSTLPEHIRMHAFSDGEEVYLRRFENCAWRGLSASHRDGGVSNSETPSESPSVALHDGATCVSWMEHGGEQQIQLVRCHD